MTKLDIINEARKAAGVGVIGSIDAELDTKTYEFHLDDLLAERPWLFTISRGRDTSLTTDGPDLGYRYKYRLSVSDVIDVLDINPMQKFNSILATNPREALKYGLAVDFPGEEFLRTENADGFVFVDGILHTDSPVTEYVYRRTVDPSVMNASFRLLLIYTLAERYVSDTHENPTRQQFIRSEKRKQHTKAAYQDNRPPADPYYRALYNWIRHFYQDSYIRG